MPSRPCPTCTAMEPMSMSPGRGSSGPRTARAGTRASSEAAAADDDQVDGPDAGAVDSAQQLLGPGAGDDEDRRVARPPQAAAGHELVAPRSVAAGCDGRRRLQQDERGAHEETQAPPPAPD